MREMNLASCVDGRQNLGLVGRGPHAIRAASKQVLGMGPQLLGRKLGTMLQLSPAALLTAVHTRPLIRQQCFEGRDAVMGSALPQQLPVEQSVHTAHRQGQPGYKVSFRAAAGAVYCCQRTLADAY
jgi:hypothetical protein